MSTVIRAERALTAAGAVSPGVLAIDEGRIVGLGAEVEAGHESVEFPGATLASGYIDMHVHGGGGFDLASGKREDVEGYARWCTSHGVTAFAPTVVASKPEEAIEIVQALASAPEVPGGARIIGINVEGPFVSRARRGALPAGWMAEANPALLDRLVKAAGQLPLLMTIAPEIEGGTELIERAVRAGVRVAIGHTDARAEQAAEGFGAGASHVTHAFNGMRPFHHREPGPLGAALAFPEVTVEVIADGVHLHPETVRLLIRAFGPERVALVTDGVRPAGLGDGRFALGGQEARLEAGTVRLADGTIAGSGATLDEVLRNVVRWGVAGPAEASWMASAVPARVLGINETVGAVEPGMLADLVVLDAELRVLGAYVGGAPAVRVAQGGGPVRLET